MLMIVTSSQSGKCPLQLVTPPSPASRCEAAQRLRERPSHVIHVHELAAWKRLHTCFMYEEEICDDDCLCEL